MVTLDLGPATFKNPTDFAVTTVKAGVLALEEGALGPLTDQYLVTDTGMPVDWYPFKMPRGLPNTYPDGTYRFIRVLVKDTQNPDVAVDYTIRRTDSSAGDRTWSQHADVTTGMGTVPTNGVGAGNQGQTFISMQVGEQGLAAVNNVFSDADSATWTSVHDGFLSKIWRVEWSGNSVHNLLFVEFYKDCNHAFLDGLSTFSDPNRVDMKIPVQVRYGFRNVWFIPKRSWHHQSASTATYASWNVNPVNAGTQLGTYQSVPFYGYLVWGQSPTGADLDTFNAIKQMRDGNVHGKHAEPSLSCGHSFRDTASWGPRGLTPGIMPPYASEAAMKVDCRSVAEEIRDQGYGSTNPWDLVLKGQTHKVPPNPGGKAGDGNAPYWWWCETNVEELASALELVAHQEWWRPIRQLEANGTIVTHQNHPDLVIFQGKVFSGNGASPDPNNDILGKNVIYNPATHALGQWFPFDKAHGDIFAQLAFLYMSGSPMIAEMMDHQLELLIMEMPTIARYNASSALGNEFLLSKDQCRNTRGLRAALWIHHLSKHTTAYTAISQHASEMWNENMLRTRTSPQLAQSGNNGGPFPTNSHLGPPWGTNKTWADFFFDEDNSAFETSADSNNLGNGVPANIQWQHAFLIDAALCWEVFDPVAAAPMIAMAEVCAQKVIDHSLYFDDQTYNGWHFFNQVFYNDGDALPAAELPPTIDYNPSNGLGDNSTIGPGQSSQHPWWRASLQGQSNWCMAAVQMGYLLAVRSGDNARADRAAVAINDWHRNNRYGSSIIVPSGADSQNLAVAIPDLFTNFPLSEPGIGSGSASGTSTTSAASAVVKGGSGGGGGSSSASSGAGITIAVGGSATGVASGVLSGSNSVLHGAGNTTGIANWPPSQHRAGCEVVRVTGGSTTATTVADPTPPTNQWLRIHKAIKDAIDSGTFYPLRFDKNTGDASIDFSRQVKPKSVAVTEDQTNWRPARSFRRHYAEERSSWVWRAKIQFTEQIAAEAFEASVSDRSIAIARDVDNQLPGLVVRLLTTEYSHPPEQDANRGTLLLVDFEATFLRR